MGIGQPHVNGKHARLHPEAEHEQAERHPLQRLGGLFERQWQQRTVTADGIGEEDAADEYEPADDRHPEVLDRRDLRLVGLGVYDEQERGDPEHLEEEVEGDQIAREHHAEHGREHHQARGVEAVSLHLMLEVVERVEGGGEPQEPGEQCEQHPVRIDGEDELADHERHGRADHVLSSHQGDERGGAQQRDTGGEQHEAVADVLAPPAERGHQQRAGQRPENQQHRQRVVGDVEPVLRRTSPPHWKNALAAIWASDRGSPGTAAANPRITTSAAAITVGTSIEYGASRPAGETDPAGSWAAGETSGPATGASSSAGSLK